VDDIILNKTQSIQRCVKRIEEEVNAAGDSFNSDYTRQDAAILNLIRACEQSIDLANYIVKIKKLGIPGSSRESFQLLVNHRIISEALGERLMKMTGFRNTVVHMYQDVDKAILRSIIDKHLNDFTDFSSKVLRVEVQ